MRDRLSHRCWGVWRGEKTSLWVYGLGVGGVAVLAFPPFGIPGAIFVFVALFFHLIDRAPTARHAFVWGVGVGLPFWILHVQWMRHVPVVPWVKVLVYVGVGALALAESVLWGGVAWFYYRLRPPIPGMRRAILAAGLWTLYEFLRMKGMGAWAFPWAPLWEGALPTLPFLQVLSWIGPLGWTLLAVGMSVALADSLRKGRGLSTLLIAAGFSLWWSMGNHMMRNLPEPIDTMRVAVFQPAVLPSVIGDPTEWPRMQASYRHLLKSVPEDVDLLLFSESAFYGVYPYHPSARQFVREILDATKKPMIFGDLKIDIRKTSRRFYNAALLVAPDGRVVDTYAKRQLVPFGEWIPGERQIPILQRIQLGGGHYDPGDSPEPLTWKDWHMGVLICYEGIFPHLARTTVKAGAQVLINPTNDGWFGPSLGPREHLALHRFRAIETRRAFVRVARTGISGIIYPNGEIGDTLGLMQEGVLILSVPLYEKLTPYVRWGDTPWVILALLAVLSAFFSSRRPTLSTGEEKPWE